MRADPHAEIREEVRKLCSQFPASTGASWTRNAAIPTEFVRALTEGGYLGALIPEEYGGAGLPLSAAAAILETVQAEGCNGAACHAQMYIMGTILRHGTDEQKKTYLPKIATGELRLQAFGVTEPTSGTDTTSLRTFARKEGDHYVVNGQKVWTSRAEHSDLMLLLARTTPRDQTAKRTEGLSTFIVDMREALGNGLTIRPIRTMMNHNSTEIFFDNMVVPAENLVGDGGPRLPLHPGRHERRTPADRGGMHRRRQMVPEEGHRLRARPPGVRPADRSEPGHPVPARPRLRADAGGRTDGPGGCDKFEAGETPGEEANMAKMLAADASWAAGEACIQTHGGFGFAEEYDIERKFRETRLYQVAPISTNLILSYIAEHVLGLPRSYSSVGSQISHIGICNCTISGLVCTQGRVAQSACDEARARLLNHVPIRPPDEDRSSYPRYIAHPNDLEQITLNEMHDLNRHRLHSDLDMDRIAGSV